MLHFREELEELQSRLLEMGGLVEAAIHNSVLALVDRDEDKAKEVMWNEALVNQKEIEIDELATRLLALFQPMARNIYSQTPPRLLFLCTVPPEYRRVRHGR